MRMLCHIQQLPSDNIAECTVGKLPENFRKKNRFMNILPCKHMQIMFTSM